MVPLRTVTCGAEFTPSRPESARLWVGGLTADREGSRLARSGEHAEAPSVMPSRQPGAAIARALHGLAVDPGTRIEWPDDFPSTTTSTTPPPDSLRRVLDGLRNLR